MIIKKHHEPRIAEQKEHGLKVIPLGGLGEIGRNCAVLEYGNDIIVIDMGIGFPDEDMPGIDFLLPNVQYLQENKSKIRGVLFTHGHYDHIGAAPYLLDKIGNPPVFAPPLAAGIMKRRHDEFPKAGKLNLHTVQEKDQVKLGSFMVSFFHVNHSIPDDFGLKIDTPIGTVITTSDFKIDETPINDKPADLEKLRSFGQKGVLLLMGDSTGAEAEGHSLSEQVIQESLDRVFKQTKGRIIAATFASLINRVQQIIMLAEKYNRKVIIEGYSMKTNVEISKQLGYIKSKKGTIISIKNAHEYPDNQIVLICPGAQGEDNAVLMRIANKTHKNFRFKQGDTVILSSSVIPGNERAVQALKDMIFKQGAEVFSKATMMDIHASGHGQRDDLRKMLELIKPRFFMPVHGNYSMLVMHARLAEAMGMDKKNIVVVENGQIVNTTKDKIWIDKKTVPSNYIMVDGLGVGDIGEVVLRDRQQMSEDGMFVIIALVDAKTGQVKGSPDIISRGFVYLRASKDLLAHSRKLIREIVEHSTRGGAVNWTYVKDNIRDEIGEFLYKKTQRRPMVLPVVIEV